MRIECQLTTEVCAAVSRYFSAFRVFPDQPHWWWFEVCGHGLSPLRDGVGDGGAIGVAGPR